MNSKTRASFRALGLALVATAAMTMAACGNDPGSAPNTAADGGPHPPDRPAPAGAGDGTAPDTSTMGQVILEKINAMPAIEGKATLVEFRQKSIATEKLGDSMQSAVVEFEGVVTFSSDVEWRWQGPTRAGEPQKFEAHAEYVNQGNGWQLVPPLGIYPL